MAAGQLVGPTPLVPAALANDECGGVVADAATCGLGGNPYASGIIYNNPTMTLSLSSGVAVNTTTTGNIGVWLQGSGIQTLNMAAGTSVTTAGGSDAVLIIGSPPNFASPTGPVTVNAAGTTVSVSGDTGYGFDLFSQGALAATVGDVTVGGNGGVGVWAVSTGGAVSVTTEDVTANGTNISGFPVYGVYGQGNSVTINTTGGAVSLTGANTSPGIYALAAGAVDVRTAGVTVAGNNSGGAFTAVNGVRAISGGSTGVNAVSVDTSAGGITLTGATATGEGILAQSNTGAVTVTTANVSTKAASAHGIVAETSGSGAVNGAVTVNSSAGLVTTQGAGAIGINVYRPATAIKGPISVTAGDVTTTGTGAAYAIRVGGEVTLSVIADDLSTVGAGAMGISLNPQGAGTQTVTVNVDTITTTGLGSKGIVMSGGGVTQVTTTGATTTDGNDADGIDLSRNGSAATTVNAATIVTHGTNANGIRVRNGRATGNGGAITVTANAITTTGDTAVTGGFYVLGEDSSGISVFTEGTGANGRIVIDTSVGTAPGTLGTVNVSGYKSSGIVAQSGHNENNINYGGGQIDITAGDVTVSGNYGAGITATNIGSSAITINVLGMVTTSGNLQAAPGDPSPGTGAIRPNGITAWATGSGDITITTHDVLTSGTAARGVSADASGGGAVTIDTTAGTIHSTDVGIAALGQLPGSTSPGRAIKVTTGTIITEGAGGTGVQAQAGGPGSSIAVDTSAGSVTTKGSNATAVNAIVGDPATAADTVPITIRTSAIRTEGDGSTGINAWATGGTIDIIAFGHITALQGTGIATANWKAGTTTIDVRGGIDAGSHAIMLDNMFATPGTNVILISSAVTATGADTQGTPFDGIRGIVGPTTINIASGGSIVAAGMAVTLAPMTTGTNLTNNGTLTGNSGTAVEFVGTTGQTFTNGGAVNGGVLLGDGADTAILLPGSTITGNLDGQAGVDLLQLGGTVGAGTFDPSKALNFETAQKTGAGTWSLTGNGTTLTAFDVQAGKLAVNGTFPGLGITVQSGATLSGTGTTGVVNVLPGGTHAPGNSIGTQTISGNYVLGGTLQVEINPLAADKVIVTGDVTLTGSTLDVMEETQFGWQPNQSFTIIDNQGPNAVVGTFATVRNVYAFLAPTVSYTGDDGNNVVLSIARNQIQFPAMGLTPNQQAAGAGAESTGQLSPVYLALVVLPAAGVPAAFDQISGEVHASIKAAGVEDSRFIREAVVQRTHRIFEDEEELGAWMQAYGAMERRAGDGNAAAIGVGTGGLLFGGDGIGDNGWYVGVVGGIGHTRFDVPDRSSSGTSDNAHIAAYATGSLQGVILRFGAAYTQHSIQTTRTPAFQGFGETLTARYDAGTAQVFGEIGYPLDVAGLTVEPFVGLAGVFQHSNGFTETGGISALTAPAGSYQAAIASIGIRVSDSFVLSNGMEVEAFGSVAWRQAIGSTPTSTHAFAGGAPFTVASAPLSGGALNIEVGAGIKVNENTRLDLSYSGQFSGATMSHAAKATLHISF